MNRKNLTYLTWVIFIGFLTMAIFAKLYPMFVFDLPITQVVQAIYIPGFDKLMVLISDLGGSYWGGFSVLIICVGFYILRRYMNIFLILSSVLLTSTLSQIAKRIINRPRPDPNLIKQHEQFLVSGSFPSGHVLFAMGFYGFLLVLVLSKMKESKMRNVLVVLLLSMIIFMGVSRIYLGAHWLSDILGSYLLGSAWLILVFRFLAI